MGSEHHCDDCNGECDCGVECDCNHSQGNLGTQMPQQFDEETRVAIQEIQMLEQNFEQLMQQKHLFNMELSETDLALKEIEKSEGDLFKIVGGQVVIKTSKEKLTADLKHKKELIELRMKSMETQEKEFSDRMEDLRKEIMKKISPSE
jgi:prefoldin beta subunit